MRAILYSSMILCLLLCISVNAFTDEQGQKENPQTNIKCSGPMDVDYETNIAVFHDDVFVDDPGFKLWADVMTVHFEEGLQTINRVIAVGSVRIEKEDRKAKAEHAVYTVSDGRIVLTGNPLVKKDEDVLSGDQITFFRDDNRMLIEPKAKLIIYTDDPEAADEDFF